MDIWNLNRIAERLEQLDIAIDREAMSLARWIWEDILELDPQTDIKFNQEKQEKFNKSIDRLLAGEPVQYIAGHSWFYGLKLKVNPHVLIPRPETEELVEWIIDDYKKSSKNELCILDIGTGSGCIALVLKKYLGDKVKVTAIDISEKAIQVAEENCNMLNLKIEILQRDFLSSGFTALGPFDIIVSNPPYISRQVAGDDIVRRLKYEPDLALYPPGTDPDIFYRKISEEAGEYLNEGGSCYLELNEFREKSIEDYFRKNNWKEIEVRIDLQGMPRMMKVQ